MSDRFCSQLNILGINLNSKQEEQFSKYYDLLIEWNKVMNLTSIIDKNEVYEKHFIDSLCIAKKINIKSIETVIDIGTGAGFPGIPIKIVFPHLQVVLIDSLKKRVGFLNTIIKKIGLNDIVALHGRAEDYAKMNEYREQFDLCVSRAVANLSILNEYCLPFVKIGGLFVSYKSENVENEVEQSEYGIDHLGGKLEKVEKFYLPDSDIRRSFVCIRKISETEKRYPRKAGIPEKKPLV